LCTILLGASIFVLDLSIELGVAGGVPYIIFVLMGMSYRNKKVTLLLGVIALVLTMLGFFFSQDGQQEIWKSLLNRGYAILAIIMVSLFAYFQQKVLQERNDKTEEKFTNLSNLTFEGILIHDQGVIIDINLSFESMFGYTRKELVGKNSIDLLFQKKHHKLILKSIDKNYTRPFEIEGIRKDASVFPLEIEARGFVSNNGEKLRVSALRDVTERRVATKALKKSEKKFREIFEKSSDAILIIKNGAFIDCNHATVELLGYKLKETFLNSHPSKLSPEFQPDGQKSKQKAEEMMALALKNGTHRFEWMHTKSDGKIFPVEVLLTTISNESSKQVIHCVWRDITERKATEKALKEALDKAKESDKLKSAFLANMSHEIRTPMNGIIGFSEFLLEPNLSEKGRKGYAEVVIACSKQLLSIVNDILDISKIEAGTIQLNYENVNINELLEDLYTFYQPKAKECKLDLSCNKGLEHVKSVVEIDKTKLNQVLINLLSNAFKFTEDGSIAFGYQLVEDTLEFYVKDTGVGIDEKHKNKIFDRFFQEKFKLNKLHKGTGLGLPISKTFVELFGGELWYTTHTKGTTMYFTIPYSTKEVPTTSVFIEEKPAAIQAKDKDLTILIADDEAYNMMYMNELFSRTNFKIIEAQNGKQAVELFTSNSEIDIILMDIQMPVMNGIEAMELIKEIKPTIPIIALSAFAMESDKKNALDHGFDAYLPKPLDRKLFFNTIKKYTEEKEIS